jgi:hypothetical protein
MKAKDLLAKRDLPPNIVIVGPAGSGKTSFALTLGEHVDYWEIDGNVRAGLHCGDGLDHIRGEVEIWAPEPMTNPRRNHPFIQIEKRVDQIHKEGSAFPVSCLDSLSTVCNLGLHYHQTLDNTLDKPVNQRQWGQMASDVLRFMFKLRHASTSVVILAHENRDELNGELLFSMGAPGKKVNKDLPPTFSDIWYSATRKGTRNAQFFEIYTKPFGSYPARSSSDLPNPLDATQGFLPVFEAMGWPLEEVAVES